MIQEVFLVGAVTARCLILNIKLFSLFPSSEIFTKTYTLTCVLRWRMGIQDQD